MNEFLGLIIPATDKAAIKKIAKKNNLSISDTARMLHPVPLYGKLLEVCPYWIIIERKSGSKVD